MEPEGILGPDIKIGSRVFIRAEFVILDKSSIVATITDVTELGIYVQINEPEETLKESESHCMDKMFIFFDKIVALCPIENELLERMLGIVS